MSFSMPTKIQNEKESALMLIDHMLRGTYFPCKCYHVDGSCRDRFLYKTAQVFRGLLKVCIPVHVVPTLMFKLKTLQ